MNIDNNIVQYLCKVISIATKAIILQYVILSKKHTVQLKLTQCYPSNLFNRKKKQEKSQINTLTLYIKEL